MEGKLPGLFKSVWPHLEHLDLMGTRILETDLEFLILACNGTKKRLTNLTSLCLTISEGLKTCFSTKFFVLPWLNLKRCYVINKCTDTSIRRDLSNAIRQNKLQNLTCLAINTMDLETLCSDNLSNLRVLHLIFSTPFRDFQKVIKTEMLSEIKLSSEFGLKVNIPSLITSSSLGQLTTLILNDSELSSNDLASLAQAELKGCLPLLKHLEMRFMNSILINFKCLFDGPCTWNKLLILDIRMRCTQDSDNKVIDYMNEIVSLGYLPSLTKLGINRFENRNVHWKKLERLMLRSCEDEGLRNIADAVVGGFLPVLHTICVEGVQGYDADIVRTLSQFGVSCHRRNFPVLNPFQGEKYLCGIQEKYN